MTQEVKSSKVHWPSILWFSISAVSALDWFGEPGAGSAFLTVGFLCMGYSSRNLLPADFLTQNLSLSGTNNKQPGARKVDVGIQVIGFACFAIGLVSKWYT